MRGWLILLVVQLVLAVSVSYENQCLLVPLALLPVLLLDPRALGILLRWKLLLVLGAMVAGVPLVGGSRSGTLFGVPYSPEYVEVSVVMAYRSILILLALRLFTRRISLEELAERARATRFRRFGESFALAMELLPPLRTTALQAYREYRGTMPRRRVVRHTLSWTAELLARVLVHAEQIELGRAERVAR